MKIDSMLQQLGRARGRRAAAPRATGQLDEIGALPVGISPGPGAPGAPLHDVLALLQHKVPGVTGLLVRDGVLFVAYEQPPDEAAREAARAALGDDRALAGLAAREAAPIEPARGPFGAHDAAAPASLAGELRAQLLDAQLPDDAWLRVFRRYQVALLSAAEPGPARPDETR